MQKQSYFLFSFFFLISIYTLSAQSNTDAIVELIFQKTNQLRKAKGLPPLKPLDSLNRLAQYHSDNMVEKAFYSHVDPAGLTPVTRAEKLGIQAWRKKGNTLIGVAENIAQVPWFKNVNGCGDTQSAEAFASCMVEGWKKSPPHYKNIMGDYIYLGIGLQFNQQKVGLGTQVFR